MSFASLYRASMYVMLALATLILSINAQDYNRFTMLFPIAVAVSGLVAFMTVDRNPKLGLGRDLANFLAMGSFVLALMEYWAEPSALPLALGHWLVYLQLIKMFLPKTIEDDWFLFLLGLVQVVIGGFISQSQEVGVLIIVWALTSLWTLGLFHLHREAQPTELAEGVTITPAPNPSDPYRGLFNLAFVLAAVRVAMTTLILGTLIFFIMPRWNVPGASRGGLSGATHLTGFSDEVRLGAMGEILENDSVVMTIELFDGENRKIQLVEEPLWRGVALARYEDGRWFRQDSYPVLLTNSLFPPIPKSDVIRQEIKIVSTDSDVLFALRPFYGARSKVPSELSINIIDGGLYRRELRPDNSYEQPVSPRSGSFDYTVISSTSDDPIQPLEAYPSPGRRRSLLSLPEQARPRLEAIVKNVLRDSLNDSAETRARNLEAYLRDSGQFSYTLRMDRVDPNIDPVLDFLENRKQGHCEYFASSLALLLRANGIPARLVNGFKGGDWNNLFSLLTVRQKHAHSWVEALVDRGPDGEPVWIVLDPTPAQQRDEVVAQVGGISPQFRNLTDAIRYIWIFYIVGFDQERQYRLIYLPIKILIRDAGEGFAMMFQALRTAAGVLFHFENVNEFFSVRGFLVSFFALLLAAGLIRLLQWQLRRLLAKLRGAGRDERSLTSSVAFYHRLTRLLAASGLERPPAETPREFARRASGFLTTRTPEAEGLAEVPAEVVDAFYRVRFGQQALGADELQRLESRLDALESGLRPS